MKDPMDGFSVEWMTCGRHRVRIDVRDGFPSEFHRDLVTLAERRIEHEEWAAKAQIVSLFDDDTNGCVSIHVAIVHVEGDPGEEIDEDSLSADIAATYGGQLIGVQVERFDVTKRETNSDHWSQAEYAARMHWKDVRR